MMTSHCDARAILSSEGVWKAHFYAGAKREKKKKKKTYSSKRGNHMTYNDVICISAK